MNILNKFELVRFAIKSTKLNDVTLDQGRFDCICNKFYTNDAKIFMNYYNIEYVDDPNSVFQKEEISD